MELKCPNCANLFATDPVTVETDIVFCPDCKEVYKISELMACEPEVIEFGIANAPHGAWFRKNFDGWTLGSTLRSGGAFLLIPFMCAWSWYTLKVYGIQIAEGKFNLGLSLIGLPFLAVNVVLVALTLMAFFGKVTVSVERDAGRVFTGVGSIGWTRRFAWSEIHAIEDRDTGSTFAVVLVGNDRLKFRIAPDEKSREYVVQTLRSLLASRDALSKSRRRL